jgi:hypothetical protein
LGFLEDCPVVGINTKVERVVRHHREHQAVAEHAGLAEHPPHRDAAERSELLAQKFGKAVAGNHPPSSVRARRVSSGMSTVREPSLTTPERHVTLGADRVFGQDLGNIRTQCH